MNGLWRALAFLTRLAKPGADAASGLPFFGAAGLVVGFLCCCGAALGALFLFFSVRAQAPIAVAWLWLTLEIWLTRALHWDGVADLGDAVGAGAVGERFWAILKDSRAGAFGVISLVSVYAGQLLGASLHLARLGPQSPACAWATAFLPLLLAPCWGRLTPVWLAARVGPRSERSLAAFVCANSSLKVRLWNSFQALFCLAALALAGVPLWRLIFLICAQVALNGLYIRTARALGGVSGDFFGCSVETAQTLFLWLTVI